MNVADTCGDIKLISQMDFDGEAVKFTEISRFSQSSTPVSPRSPRKKSNTSPYKNYSTYSPSTSFRVNIEKKKSLHKKSTTAGSQVLKSYMSPRLPNINEREERKDYFGTLISKENKKQYKVCFIDKISNNNLCSFVDIENYKIYNEPVPIRKKFECSNKCIIF
jgi:hypothetical protein